MINTDRLVWIDLEMTGLNANTDHIIEIATVVTDGDLNLVEIGPELVIFQEDHILEAMNDWCREHHGLSGLTDRVRRSEVTIQDASDKTLAFIKKHVRKENAPLCGNSIHQDRNFLSVHMPEVHGFLHYRNVDVSSIKELAFRWYPELPKFSKANKHTALEDILESIEELRYYRSHLFV